MLLITLDIKVVALILHFFDCSLGSTYGFTAGVLIEHGLTGLCVAT